MLLEDPYHFNRLRLKPNMQKAIRSLATLELVAEAAAQWAATSKASLLDDVTNLVYAFTSAQGRRILRLTHISHHTEAEILAELDWINFLTRKGVPACEGLLSRNNRLTESFSVGDSYFIATGFEFAPGHMLDDEHPLSEDPALTRSFGQVMGRMHRATKAYRPEGLPAKRLHWYEDDLIRNAATYLPSDQRQAADDMAKLIYLFSSLIPTPDDYGLVHGDLNPTNMHIHDRQLIVFDFDDCAYNWFINDIAIAMPLYSERLADRDWEAWMTAYFQHFMRGYSAENQLEAGWLEMLPASLRLQNILDLIACHESDIPQSQYRSFYELVLKIYREGHPLFHFDFCKAYPGIDKKTYPKI